VLSMLLGGIITITRVSGRRGITKAPPRIAAPTRRGEKASLKNDIGVEKERSKPVLDQFEGAAGRSAGHSNLEGGRNCGNLSDMTRANYKKLK